MSDVPLLVGAPGVGQTSGGELYGGDDPPPVGSYPQTQSYSGLLDVSGGQQE